MCNVGVFFFYFGIFYHIYFFVLIKQMSVVLILAQSKPVSRKHHEQCKTKAGSGQRVLIVVETSLFCVHLVYTVWQMSPLHPFCSGCAFGFCVSHCSCFLLQAISWEILLQLFATSMFYLLHPFWCVLLFPDYSNQEEQYSYYVVKA